MVDPGFGLSSASPEPTLFTVFYVPQFTAEDWEQTECFHFIFEPSLLNILGWFHGGLLGHCWPKIARESRQDTWVVCSWRGLLLSTWVHRFPPGDQRCLSSWFINTFEVWCQFDKDKLISLTSQLLVASTLVLSAGSLLCLSLHHWSLDWLNLWWLIYAGEEGDGWGGSVHKHVSM